jgi:hypothetical protein
MNASLPLTPHPSYGIHATFKMLNVEHRSVKGQAPFYVLTGQVAEWVKIQARSGTAAQIFQLSLFFQPKKANEKTRKLKLKIARLVKYIRGVRSPAELGSKKVDSKASGGGSQQHSISP